MAGAALKYPRDADTWLLVVVVAGLLVAPEPVWALGFYALLPWLGWHVWKARAGLSVTLWIAAVLIIWQGMTIAWDGSAAGHPRLLALWAWNPLCTLVFVLAIGLALRDDAWRERLVDALIGCGAINVVISIARQLMQPGWEPRMPGWAETRHPILGAAIIGVIVLLAAARVAEGRRPALHAGVALLGLGFIGLTGSRGPMLAIGGALALLLLLRRWRWLVGMIGVGLMSLGVGFIVAPERFTAMWHGITDRGGSHRLEIWSRTLEVIDQAPTIYRWIGFGPTALIGRPAEDFPHNLFLSTLFYSGLIGLALLLTLFVVIARQSGQALKWPLLIYVVLTGMTDLSNLTKGPSPMWYVLWLPLLLASPNGQKFFASFFQKRSASRPPFS